MTKFKMILLLLLIAVLVDFALENPLPTQELKLFKFTLGHLPTFLLTYAALTLGLLVGWFGHVFRIRKKRKLAASALAREQQAQQSQPGQEAAL